MVISYRERHLLELFVRLPERHKRAILAMVEDLTADSFAPRQEKPATVLKLLKPRATEES